MKFIPFLFFLLFAARALSAGTPDPSAIERVAKSQYWLRLLHFHGGRSDVNGEKFFLSPVGRKNARAELLASLEAFEKGGLVGRDPNQLQHPQCAFPERFRYLTLELGLTIPKVDCPLYESFMSRFQPEGATLVFSAAYPYNPGSMFGHTFLRINSAQTTADGKAAKKMDLLDHGLGYAASVANQDNSIGFMWSGLTGGFTGNFTISPYYLKVNEYNNAESRDLWEYELNLNGEQTTRLLAHTWELEMNGTFDYYFFTANCSYQLLGLLEVARPDWNLSSGWVHVIPSETVKALTNIPGAVRSVNFRPSLYKKALLKIRDLNPDQRQKYEMLMKGSNFQETDVTALSAAIAHFYYMKQKKSGHLPDEEHKRFEKILIARSKVKEPNPPDPSVPGISRPDLGHYANRVGTAAGLIKRGGNSELYFQDLHFRPAYHDLLNDDRGFTPFSEIQLFSFTLRTVPREKNFVLEEIKLASVVSLTPWTPMEKPISWKVLAGYLSPKDVGCFYCKVGHFEAGAGLSVYLDSSSHALFYGLLKLQAEVGSGLPRNFRLNQGGEAGLLWNPIPALKTELSGQVFTDFLSSLEEKLYAQFRFQISHSLGRRWDLRSSIFQSLPWKNAALRHREMQLGLNLYF